MRNSERIEFKSKSSDDKSSGSQLDLMLRLSHSVTTNLNIINEEDEFTQNEKMKISQISSLYKNNNIKHGNDEKSTGKIKYL